MRVLNNVRFLSRKIDTYISPGKLTKSYVACNSEVGLTRENIAHFLAKTADESPNKKSFIYPEENFYPTWSEFNDQARSLAHSLLSLGCSKGDRVAIFAPNIKAWTQTQFACHYTGLVLVCLNPQFTAKEADFVLKANIQLYLNDCMFEK